MYPVVLRAFLAHLPLAGRRAVPSLAAIRHNW